MTGTRRSRRQIAAFGYSKTRCQYGETLVKGGTSVFTCLRGLVGFVVGWVGGGPAVRLCATRVRLICAGWDRRTMFVVGSPLSRIGRGLPWWAGCS